MKTKSMIFCVVAMMSISGGLVCALDNPSQSPMGMPVGGRGMGGGFGFVSDQPAKFEDFPRDRDQNQSPIVARCLLKISCDPSILSLDYRIMKHLWYSTDVLDKAYRTVLNDGNSLGGPGGGEIVLVNDAGAPANMVYAVGIPDSGSGKEKQILAAAVENLKFALSKLGDEERDRLSEQLNQTERRCDEMEKQVAEMQVGVRDITQGGVTGRQEIQDKISSLKNSLADTQMRLEYSDIRINELRKQKEELQIAIEKSLAADTVIEELKNIVKGTEDSLVMIEKRFSAGQAPADNIQEAKEKLARAKIELARRMEEVRKNAGQDQLADIDGKIAAVNSQVSELKLSLQFKNHEYSSMTDLLAKSDALELRTMKLDAAKKSFYEMLSLRENLKNRLLMQQPLSVSVIGMD